MQTFTAKRDGVLKECLQMASNIFHRVSSAVVSRSSSSSSATAAVRVRHRLPLVCSLCFLTLGITNFTPILSSSSFKPTWSGFGRQSTVRAVHSSAGMEANNNNNNSTVPTIVVYVTVPHKEAGKKLAESIVKEKLAACVNRVPGIESVYLWEGKIETDSEELLIIKTRESLLEALTAHVKANHEYDTPEVIAMPIVGGSPQYLEWIKNSTRD